MKKLIILATIMAQTSLWAQDITETSFWKNLVLTEMLVHGEEVYHGNFQEKLHKLNMDICDGEQVGSVNPYQDSLPVPCEDSKAPLFQSQEVLEIEVMADIALLNGKKGGELAENYAREKQPAIISYKDGDKVISIVASVEARGQSRLLCPDKSFRVNFLQEDITASIKNSAEKSLGSNDKNIQKRMYQRALEKAVSLTSVSAQKKQENNIFKGLGDNMKINVECGSNLHNDSNGSSRAASQQRLLMESTMHQMIDALGSTTMKVRPVKITYKNSNGDIVNTRMAFVRESEAKVAKRCGMKKGKPGKKEVVGLISSDIQAGLIRSFLSSGLEGTTGGNNVKIYDKKSIEGKAIEHIVPYDFDNSAIIANKDDSKSSLEKFLKSADQMDIIPQQSMIVQSFNLLEKRPEMLKVIENSALAQVGKDKLTKKVNEQMEVIENFLTEKHKNSEVIFKSALKTRIDELQKDE